MASQDWFEKDFYKTLGVAKDVSETELKKVYRKLSRQYHPDTNPGDAKAEAKFKEISEAYSVLSDKQQRTEYDQVRAMGGGARFTGGAGFPGGAGGFGGQGFPGGASGFEDVFANLFGGNGGGFGGGGFGGFGGPQRGGDLTTSKTIDFIDSVKGATVKMQLHGLSPGNHRGRLGLRCSPRRRALPQRPLANARLRPRPRIHAKRIPRSQKEAPNAKERNHRELSGRCSAEPEACFGRLLGRMVWPVPNDCADS